MCSPFAGPSGDQESAVDLASSYEACRNRMNTSELSGNPCLSFKPNMGPSK